MSFISQGSADFQVYITLFMRSISDGAMVSDNRTVRERLTFIHDITSDALSYITTNIPHICPIFFPQFCRVSWLAFG